MIETGRLQNVVFLIQTILSLLLSRKIIKLPNQSYQQVKDGLVIEAGNTTMIFFLNTKTKCAVRSIAIKEEAKNVALIKKRRIKGEIYITVMNFADYLRKLDVSENSKVYYG